MTKDKIGLIIREVERDLANSDDEKAAAAADILKQHGFRTASFTSLTIGGSLY